MGHFYSLYKYTTDLKLRFGTQLDKLFAAGFFNGSSSKDDFSHQRMAEIRRYRAERFLKVEAGEHPNPVGWIGDIKLVIHVIPLSYTDAPNALRIENAVETPDLFPPIWTDDPNAWRLNSDGFLALNNKGLVTHSTYLQVFRNGVVKAVAPADSSEGVVDTQLIEPAIVTYTLKYLRGVMARGINAPFVVAVSLIGVKGKLITTWPTEERRLLSSTPHSDQIHLGEIVIKKQPEDYQDCATQLRPLLDHLANAAGSLRSTNFDEAGQYKLKPFI